MAMSPPSYTRCARLHSGTRDRVAMTKDEADGLAEGDRVKSRKLRGTAGIHCAGDVHRQSARRPVRRNASGADRGAAAWAQRAPSTGPQWTGLLDQSDGAIGRRIHRDQHTKWFCQNLCAECRIELTRLCRSATGGIPSLATASDGLARRSKLTPHSRGCRHTSCRQSRGSGPSSLTIFDTIGPCTSTSRSTSFGTGSRETALLAQAIPGGGG
jgi:hypothetical protein